MLAHISQIFASNITFLNLWLGKIYPLQRRPAEILWGRRLSRAKGRDLEGGRTRKIHRGMHIFWKPT